MCLVLGGAENSCIMLTWPSHRADSAGSSPLGLDNSLMARGFCPLAVALASWVFYRAIPLPGPRRLGGVAGHLSVQSVISVPSAVPP